MKTVLFWIGACCVALYLILRYRRGAPRRLAGGYSARFVSMVSMLLVAAGCGSRPKQEPAAETAPQERESAPPPLDAAVPVPVAIPQESDDVLAQRTLTVGFQDLFPHTLSEAELTEWLVLQSKYAVFSSYWLSFKRAVMAKDTPLSPSGYPAWFKDLRALQSRSTATPEYLLKLLLQAERAGVFDTWIVGYLYQASEQSESGNKAELFSFLESHNRVAEAFTIALGHSKIVRPRAWMSKAGPSRSGPPSFANSEAFLREAKRRYKKQDSGTWGTQARVAIALESGEALLHRRGTTTPLDSRALHLLRLDAIETKSDCVLKLPFLGTLVLPKGIHVTSTSLHHYLGDGAKALAESYIAGALTGDPEAIRKVSTLLPILKSDLREALAAASTNDPPKGAATVRSLLFDADW